MHPYREIGIVSKTSEPKKKKRPFFKTLYLKYLIWRRGPWKKRFKRCPDCLFVFKNDGWARNVIEITDHFEEVHNPRTPKSMATRR